MKTFRIRNRHGVEHNVTESIAASLVGNPSVKILGEVDATMKEIEVEIPDKTKTSGFRTMKKKVVDTFELIKEAIPGVEDADLERKGNLLKKKSIVDRSRKTTKKSSMLND